MWRAQVDRLKAHDALVLFSGDCFSPSLASNMSRGEHVPHVLNALGVHVACIGNHDFDFGADQTEKLCRMCNFPWLAANITDKATGGHPLVQLG